MPKHQIHPITDYHYELVDADELPDGRVCWIEETPGTAVSKFLRGHATQELVDFMTTAHRPIIEHQLWQQYWEPGAARLEAPVQGLGYARARWELLRPGDEHIMKPDDIAVPLERNGEFIWVVRPPHASAQAIEEFSLLLARLVQDGLWRQNLGGGS